VARDEPCKHGRDGEDDAEEADAFDDARREQNNFVRCAGADHIADRDSGHSAGQRSPSADPADDGTRADTHGGAHRGEDRNDQAGEIQPEREVGADHRNRDDRLADLCGGNDSAADQQQRVQAPRATRRSPWVMSRCHGRAPLCARGPGSGARISGRFLPPRAWFHP
jgi:hypothetical protein